MTDPTREDIDLGTGPLLLEFGASWCPICREAAPVIGRVRDEFPEVAYLKIEDGPGRPLGRSFGVKLWPTLVFLLDGQVLSTVVRPRDEDAVRAGFHAFPVSHTHARPDLTRPPRADAPHGQDPRSSP